MMGLPPKETTRAIKDQLKEIGDLQNTAASVLYSNWVLQNMPKMLGIQTGLPSQEQQKKDDFYDEVKRAYLDAVKIKAFQSVFGTSTPIETQHTPQTKEKEEEVLGDELWKAFVDLVKKDPNKAREFLSSLSEQDIQTMMILSNMTGKPNPLIPFLTYSRRMEKREDGGKSDTVETTKAILEALKTGVEIGKSSTPPQQQGLDQLTTTLLNLVISLVKEHRDENNQRLLEAIHGALEKRENIYEKIMTDENLRNTLKNLFTSQSLPAEVQIELEKLRNELLAQELNMRKWLAEKKLEQANEARKLKMVSDLLQGPAGRILSDIGKKAVEGVGMGATAGANIGALATAKAGKQPIPANMMMIRCGNCGTILQVPKEVETIECPACKSLLEVKPKKQVKRKRQKVEQQEEKPEKPETSGTVQ